MTLEKPSTPCIGACKIDEFSRLCRGCRRTKAEIVAWKNLTEPERLEIMRGLALRPGFSSAQGGADGRKFIVNLDAYSGESGDQAD
jgi:hypothetical protein